MTGSTPNNPTKAPNVPTGPKSKKKSSPSKVMKPMSKASGTTMGNIPPAGRRTVLKDKQSRADQEDNFISALVKRE